jgi:hypothetical protein
VSVDLVSVSVNLKDINILDVKKAVTDLEKFSLKLMSMLDIARVSGLVSKMNADVIKSEFKSFLLELKKFSENFENIEDLSVKNALNASKILDVRNNNEVINKNRNEQKNIEVNYDKNEEKNGNGHKRKDLRKGALLEFVKGHNYVSIKDMLPNINGCSEKTIQRELIELIKEGKIKKTGERRWSRYSIV